MSGLFFGFPPIRLLAHFNKSANSHSGCCYTNKTHKETKSKEKEVVTREWNDKRKNTMYRGETREKRKKKGGNRSFCWSQPHFFDRT
jgi:hypothetical protein